MGPARHVLIYGPPGAGKLTVASSLAESFDLRVLDNHASLDPALRLFQFGDPQLMPLVEEIRVALISAAARAGRGIVSTLVAARGVDDDHVAKLSRATTDHGGSVNFVQLLPTSAVLEERVVGESRAATEKIKDVRQLRDILACNDLETPLHDDDLSIDNTDLAPAQVARLIGQAFDLPERR